MFLFLSNGGFQSVSKLLSDIASLWRRGGFATKFLLWLRSLGNRFSDFTSLCWREIPLQLSFKLGKLLFHTTI
jgi:hypothetical protein